MRANVATKAESDIGANGLDALDLRLIRATQSGLPLVPQPYQVIAQELGVSSDEVQRRMSALLASGVVRRIGAVPNHYRIGYTANGMSVWDVPDERIDEIGAQVGALSFVSHCYHRPRHLPEWRYNLYAMVHGRDRAETDAKVRQIAELLGPAIRAHAVLYSKRILKKTGLRF